MSEGDLVIDAERIAMLEALVTRSGDNGLYGLTADRGFVPKPYSQLVTEGFAAARALLGADIDLANGSVLRKLIELNALNHASLHATLAQVVDDGFVPTARGAALSRLGEELGIPRPFMRASGTVTFKLAADKLPALGLDEIVVPQGTRLTTSGGHQVVTTAGVRLAVAPDDTKKVGVMAFIPGESHDLDPATTSQKIKLFGPQHPWVADTLLPLAQSLTPPMAAEKLIAIQHTEKLTGGTQRWADDRYRDLLLKAPRSIWTPESIQFAVEMVPGVVRAIVTDEFGGVDVDRPIFGNFVFGERLFGSERDIFSPYALTIYVATEEGAIWYGPGGLKEAILAAIEPVRPVGIFASVSEAPRVPFAIRARIVMATPPGAAFKAALLERIDAHVRRLGFGEQVRAARLAWLIMSDPNVVDVQDPFIRTPSTTAIGQWHDLGEGENLAIPEGHIADFVDDDQWLTIVT